MQSKTPFDIAILGMPFDTGVTYRPGARFGPYAIRSGARRQRESRGYTMSWAVDPYSLGSKVVDCGDVCQIASTFNAWHELNLTGIGSGISV